MGQFLEILTKPDNIPIAGMIAAVAICLWMGVRQALRNDRLIKEGKKQEIYHEMSK